MSRGRNVGSGPRRPIRDHAKKGVAWGGGGGSDPNAVQVDGVDVSVDATVVVST